MKKSKILVVLLAFVLLLVGCGKETKPEDSLKLASEKMATVKSLEMQMQVEAEIKSNDLTSSLNLNGNVTIDEEKSMHLTFKTTVEEENVEVEMYMKKSEGQYTIYTKSGNFWTKQIVELKNETSTTEIPKFENAKKIRTENGLTVYEVKVSKEQLQDFVDLGAKLENVEGINLEDFQLNFEDVVMTLYVNKENYITKFEVSVPLSFEMKIEEQSIKTNITMKLTANLSKFNEIKEIVVPKTVEESVLDEEGLIVMEYVAEYADAVEWDVYEKGIENGIYTNTGLEYNGNRPTKVELKIEDLDVVSGIIELDGYTATFENREIKSLIKNK